MQEKLLAQIIADNKCLEPELLAKVIIEQFNKINYIKLERKRFESEILEARKRYEQTKKEVDEKLLKLCKTCKHEETNYFPDPSGNNDSFYECAICGANI